MEVLVASVAVIALASWMHVTDTSSTRANRDCYSTSLHNCCTRAVVFGASARTRCHSVVRCMIFIRPFSYPYSASRYVKQTALEDIDHPLIIHQQGGQHHVALVGRHRSTRCNHSNGIVYDSCLTLHKDHCPRCLFREIQSLERNG